VENWMRKLGSVYSVYCRTKQFLNARRNRMQVVKWLTHIPLIAPLPAALAFVYRNESISRREFYFPFTAL
jgi:hypothetical protein